MITCFIYTGLLADRRYQAICMGIYIMYTHHIIFCSLQYNIK